MKRRVIVIGGGIAGLTAAHELSRTEDARAEWDVEIVEMGHRLGGRLASAHDLDAHGRNEEHGLHVWFGFYDNTFRLADEVWQAYRPPSGSPWRSIWDAVRPIHVTDCGIVEGDTYRIRRAHYPRNPDRPGRATHLSWVARTTNVLDFWRALLSTLRSFVRDGADDALELPAWLAASPAQRAVLHRLEPVLERIALRIAALGVPETARARRDTGARIERLLRRVHRPIALAAHAAAGRDPGAIELARSAELLVAALRGLVSPQHGILEDGDLDRISALELSEWLVLHGASRETVEHSRALEIIYDAPFGHLGGERARRVLEASTAMRFTLRILFGYKQAVAYLLNGGAGEILVAPLHAVLEERGVRVRYFHRLVEVETDRGRVTRLVLVRSARPRDRYEPVIVRRGLRGFRKHPDWSQLEEGDALEARGVDFYSRFGDRGERDRIVLEVDRDFDDVILALPLGSILPDPDGHTPVRAWLDAHPPARACLERLHLVPTVAAQLWFDQAADAIGLAGRAVVAWAPPLSVACDMSPVIAYEDWPEPRPGACAYLCGAWPLESVRARSSDRDAKARDLARVRDEVRAQLAKHGRSLVRDATLRDPARSADPLAAQYLRVNVEPWDLADLALPGADAVRLDAADSGLLNLALAGSWVRTSMNTTSVEAAVSSGLAAARALGAEVRSILGEGWMGAPSRAPILPGRTLRSAPR